MKSYTYKLCKMMIDAGKTEGLQDKMDLFLLVGRITEDEYNELVVMLNAKK